jgi:1-acyl-sn-glycerol-3-phosphate acyltransferase
MLFKWVCTLIFKAMGWKFKNNIPDDLRSFVFIGAPHTSNSDFIMAMAVTYLMKRNARFVIKNEWMKFPLSIFFKSVGAIGVDRNVAKESKTVSHTDVIAKLFQDHTDLVLIIAPEGTRSPNKKWRTGFYYIAQKANVPIVCGYADYKTKVAGLGLVIHPKDFEKDMFLIMDFYKDMEGKVNEI